VAGTLLASLVNKIGLNGLITVAGLSLVVTAALADAGYNMSEEGGFDPAEEIKKKEESKKKDADGKGKGMVRDAVDLFGRVPVLGALFWEVIAFQSLSTILNVCLVTKLKEAVTDDSLRAAWTGKFYAYVNGISGLLQFLILPLFMSYIDPAWVYRLMPLLPLAGTVATALQSNPSLNLVAFSFFAAKVMDYTVRNVANEIVYVPLDFDSRYKGKEIIGVFGSRFGKSGISLFLSWMTYLFGDFGIRDLSRLNALASTAWMVCTFKLSALIHKTSEEEKGEGSTSNQKAEKKKGARLEKKKR